MLLSLCLAKAAEITHKHREDMEKGKQQKRMAKMGI
jgi:hypothetical protein